MNPIVSQKSGTLSSGDLILDFGFLPDWVDIINTSQLSSMASGDTIKVTGKPDDGGSNGKLVGIQAGTSNAKLVDVGNAVKHYSTDYYGLKITSVSGFGSSDDLLVTAFRENM